METFGLVDILRTYCTSKGYVFLYGDEFYQNAQSEVDKGKTILLSDPITCTPQFAGARVVSLQYNVTLAIGRKSEEETEASLDETYLQKYDRRLKDLAQKLATVIGDISCQNELDVSQCRFFLSINKFDIVADFVACSLVFSL